MSETQKSGGFMSALKSALFEDTAAKPIAAKQVDQEIPPGTPPAGPSHAGVAAAQLVQQAMAGPNPYQDQLQSLVMGKPSAYTALADAIQPLTEFIPDEGQRYKAAFATVGKTRTLESIVQAIQGTHGQTLETENSRFAQQALTQIQADVANSQRQVELVKSQITGLEDEEARTREQFDLRIKEIQTLRETATAELATTTAEWNRKVDAAHKTGEQWNQAVATVKAMLATAEEKVRKYLS